MKMIDTGINRKLDDLGRITLPIELRRSYGWPKKGTRILVSLTADHFICLERDPAHGEPPAGCAGLSRPMDPMGRLSLPSEIRGTYHLGPDTMIHYWVDPKRPMIYAKKTGCLLCGSGQDLFDYQNILFCSHCVERIRGVR